MKRQWIVLAAIVILTVLAVFQTNKGNREELPKVGYLAPKFSLTGLDGKVYSMEALQGKPVVINFWASWCGPCRLEAPELVRLYEKYGSKVEIYAVNVTINDQIENAKAFAEQYGFTFPVLLDKEGEVSGKYGINPIPATFYVNREGVIVDKVIGLVDGQTMESKFQKLIN